MYIMISKIKKRIISTSYTDIKIPPFIYIRIRSFLYRMVGVTTALTEEQANPSSFQMFPLAAALITAK